MNSVIDNQREHEDVIYITLEQAKFQHHQAIFFGPQWINKMSLNEFLQFNREGKATYRGKRVILKDENE